MASLRSRLAAKVVSLLGIRRQLQELADAEGDPEAFADLLEKVREADVRSPPGEVNPDRTTTEIDVAGSPLFTLREDGMDRAILYLHGGGYMAGPFRTEWSMVEELAKEADADLAVLLYPRAPEAGAPEAVAAARKAIEAVAAWHGPDRTVVVGTSSGGGLALAALMEVVEDGAPPPALAVLVSPAVDMALRDDVSSFEKGDVLLSADYVRTAGRLYAGDLGIDHPWVSPINGDLAGLPPLVIHAGSEEILLPGIESFAERAAAAGVAVSLVVGDKQQHTYPTAPLPEGATARDHMAAAIRKATTGS